jgi:electron transfer flavoprotein alpha/beta subunit
VKIVVCVKHVPDATADRTFTEEGSTDRESVDSLLSELDEYAVEPAPTTRRTPCARRSPWAATRRHT